MKIKTWKNTGLKGRAAIFMVIPVVFIVTVMGYLVTIDRLEYAERNFIQRGELLVLNFSSIIELSMIAQDKAALSVYADVLLKEKGIVSVLIQDIEGTTLIKKQLDKVGVKNSDINYISNNVIMTGVSVGGFKDALSGISNIILPQSIGRLNVGFVFKKTNEKQKEILYIGLISTLLGIIISAVFGYRVARVITKPILKLNSIVNKITKGDLSSRSPEGATGEIGALQKGINDMAAAMQGAQIDLQEKIKRATNDLNRTVHELELQNIALEQARHQAEELGNDKALFLARMSHELRTPLNAVIGFSRLMEKQITENERYDYTKTIINSATQLTSIIDDVLTFSKLKSNSLVLNDTNYDPRLLCEDVVLMMSSAAKNKKLELILSVEDDVPKTAEGDAGRINQVLSNLINNAIKFTTTGEVVVSLNVMVKLNKEYLEFSVTDTGCGFDESQKNELFKEFSQLQNELTRTSDGVGLGLSISRQLVKNMGGEFKVISEPGSGSSFSFHIPLINPEYEQVIKYSFNRRKDNDLSAKNVILIELNLSSRKALKKMLVRCGLQVFIANNYADVKSLIINNYTLTIDLLIVSFSVSERENEIYSDIINKIEDKSVVPIVILNSGNFDESPPDINHRKNITFLSKPLRESNLCDTIKNILLSKKENINDSVVANALTLAKELHVLVAEDNEFNKKLLDIMLKQRSINVDLVSNGQLSIDAVKEKDYDLILMDLHMPVMDGETASREIKKISNVPIVLLTADVLTNMSHLKESGVINGLIFKPITDHALDEVLHPLITFNSSDLSKCLSKEKIIDNPHMEKPLQDEIIRLCKALEICLINDTEDHRLISTARDVLHQLEGVIGYYQLDELNSEVMSLQKEFKACDYEKSLLIIKSLLKRVKSPI